MLFFLHFWLLPVTQKISDCQTWSSRDLSLGLETSRDPIFKVLVLVLRPKVLVLVSVLILESRSWSWSWRSLVLVLVLPVRVLDSWSWTTESWTQAWRLLEKIVCLTRRLRLQPSPLPHPARTPMTDNESVEESRRNNKKNSNNKMSNDMGSIPDPKMPQQRHTKTATENPGTITQRSDETAAPTDVVASIYKQIAAGQFRVLDNSLMSPWWWYRHIIFMLKPEWIGRYEQIGTDAASPTKCALYVHQGWKMAREKRRFF